MVIYRTLCLYGVGSTQMLAFVHTFIRRRVRSVQTSDVQTFRHVDDSGVYTCSYKRIDRVEEWFCVYLLWNT